MIWCLATVCKQGSWGRGIYTQFSFLALTTSNAGCVTKNSCIAQLQCARGAQRCNSTI